MKKLFITIILFLPTVLFSFDTRHAFSLDTLPTVRFLIRGGIGVGISYEMWLANTVGIDLSAAYGQAESIYGVLRVFTPRLILKYYFDYQPPFYNWLGLVIDDDIAASDQYPIDQSIGLGAGIGSKIIFGGNQGLFIEPYFVFMVKFGPSIGTATDFQLGVKAGWIF